MHRHAAAASVQRMKALTLPLLAFALAACASAAPRAPTAHDDFFKRIAALCGKAYAGRIAADEPAATGPDPFRGQALVMHVRECGGDAIRMPFHVGNDRSRTWVLTRTASGLRLKHDHRHEDGSADALTMYGGDTTGSGSVSRQEFPVDAESRALFTREGRAVSNANVWAMEIEPNRVLVYELARPGRRFRVEFDLTRPVPAPPPWSP